MTRTVFYHYRSDLPKDHHDYAGPAYLDGMLADAHDDGSIKAHRKRGLPRIKAAVLCILTDDDGAWIGRGLAFCSASDNFVTKTGRRIALGRAKKAMAETPPPPSL